MRWLIIVLVLVLSAFPLITGTPADSLDPGIENLQVVRLDPAHAQVSWRTRRPISGGVLLYSRQHAFARGLDPFTLRYVQESSEASLTHLLIADRLDESPEWRFQVSYQLFDGSKFDSPLVFPFRQEATGEIHLR